MEQEFCTNFSSKCGIWSHCQKVRCGPCYTPLDNNEFPVALPEDEDGVVMEDTKDEGRFLKGCNGDILVTPFQCDLSYFRNMLNRDPVDNLAQDIHLLKLIRRANLDALWSRETKTANNNLLSCRQGASIAASLGLKAKLFRPMGPFPLEDNFGM
jgi:hypothetical protein